MFIVGAQFWVRFRVCFRFRVLVSVSVRFLFGLWFRVSVSVHVQV